LNAATTKAYGYTPVRTKAKLFIMTTAVDVVIP